MRERAKIASQLDDGAESEKKEKQLHSSCILGRREILIVGRITHMLDGMLGPRGERKTIDSKGKQKTNGKMEA